MKRLTLDETWVLCLKMWKWTDEQIEEHGIDYAEENNLKRLWLKKQRFRRNIVLNCFFCDYACKQGGFLNDLGNCPSCPGRLVRPNFHCEKRESYRWDEKPRKFYKKLVELNKIRLAKRSADGKYRTVLRIAATKETEQR